MTGIDLEELRPAAELMPVGGSGIVFRFARAPSRRAFSLDVFFQGDLPFSDILSVVNC